MGIDLILVLLILSGELLGLLDGLVDVLLGEVGGSGDGDVLLLAGAEVLCGDIHDAVGIDVKADLDLRHAAGRRSDAGELELAQRLVIGSHFTLALQDMDLNGGLAVCSGGEDLALMRRNGGVAVDQAGDTINHHASEIFDDIYLHHADLVCFSCYIWNIEYVRQLVRNLKNLCPSVKIWVGGPEVSYDW